MVVFRRSKHILTRSVLCVFTFAKIRELYISRVLIFAIRGKKNANKSVFKLAVWAWLNLTARRLQMKKLMTVVKRFWLIYKLKRRLKRGTALVENETKKIHFREQKVTVLILNNY